MITFEDIENPASVKEVESDNLSAMFGDELKLKSISLEITDDAPTESQLENTLDWINNLEKYRTNENNPFSSTLPTVIRHLRRK